MRLPYLSFGNRVIVYKNPQPIMQSKATFFFLLALTMSCTACHGSGSGENAEATILAFPQADGGGKYTTGGRGGVVLHVTNLSDDAKDPGSLRHAINMDGTRTIVFDTAGIINLKSQLTIGSGSVTIAGQTAPGDGICIAGYPVVVKTSNVILRFLRFRMGDSAKVEGDALTICGHKNIIVDHCSFSWSTDECVSCYGNTNFTLQYCFITESLRNSVHDKGRHGYGGIWGGTNASFHHNLLAHHDSRNPRFDHSYVNSQCFGPLDFVNNVVYNWGGNSAYGGEGTGTARQINFVANYYKPGPATNSKVQTRLLNPTTKCTNCSSDASAVLPGKFYVTDNYLYGNEVVTKDNWEGVSPDESSKKEQCKATTRHTKGLTLLSAEQTAEEAYETVLSKAGCSLHRDAIDTRIAEEVRTGTATCKGSNGSTGGLIDTPTDAGGYPTYNNGTAPKDTDRDGMPDEWETAHGLDPNNASDGKLTTLQSPYTNLEVYLNSLVQDLY